MSTAITKCETRGKWVTAHVFAELHSLSEQTLSNWRFQDRRAGRTEAAPGFPRYLRFGKAVRYWLPADEQPNLRPAA